MHETNWLPALVVLALGLGVALLFLLASRARTPAAPKDPKLVDLDLRVQTLLDQLRELEVEKLEFGETYAPEKARIEKAAAAALRERDEYLKSRGLPPAVASSGAPKRRGKPTPEAPPAVSRQAAGTAVAGSAPAPSTGSRALTVLGWIAGVVAFAAIVGFVLTRDARERGDDGAMTGRVPPGAEGSPPEDDTTLQRTIARAKENPRDVETSAFAVHELIRRQRYEEAEDLTKKALAVEPFHLESRIHQAVLRSTKGDLQQALEELDRLARYPEAHEALLFRGALAMQMGDARAALDSFERFLAEAPAEFHPPQLGSAMAMLRERVEAQQRAAPDSGD